MPAYEVQLIGIGECMVECFAEQPLGQASMLQKSYGGDVLNTLITAQRLGSSSAFVTLVGNDPFGGYLQRSWQQEGIDVSGAPLVDGDNGVYFISLLEGGEREFSYRRTHSAASRMQPHHLNPAQIKSAKVLLLSGITQAISESAQATTLEAAKIAHQAGVKVVFDPNYRPKLWELRGGIAAARQAYAQLHPYLNAVLASMPADSELLDLPQQPQQAIVQLSQTLELCALKTGAEGAWVAHQGHAQRIAPVVPQYIRDSTGAGDAWNGAFLHGLIHNHPPLVCAQFANRLASAKLAFRGAIPPRGSLAGIQL